MSNVLSFREILTGRRRRPDPAAGYALEFAALSKCWAEIGQLETGAQLRIVEHLRECINERAQYEMREIQQD